MSVKKPGLFALRVAPGPVSGKLLGLATVALLGVGWWLATSGATPEERLISPVILPSPAEVVRSFPALVNERRLLESIVATMRRVLVGFRLAVAVGVPLGIVAGSWRVFD